jgi:hypothetical protein
MTARAAGGSAAAVLAVAPLVIILHQQAVTAAGAASHPPGALLRSTPQVLQTFEDDACSPGNIYDVKLPQLCCCMAHV